MYVEQNKEFTPSNGFDFHKKLPNRTFTVRFNRNIGEFYLKQIEPFSLPKKIYGNPIKYVDRYLKTFNERKGNLGILLSGIKGTGKSLLAKMICIKSNLPVLVITESYRGEKFKAFLDNIKEECVILIDEFEKIYDETEQREFLSILDGVFSGKKMFLLTSNRTKINPYMMNRPGRIFYKREYTDIPEEVLNEIVSDLLVNKEHSKELKEILFSIGSVNIDMVVSIIDEMNRYNESPKETISYLNIIPESTMYTVKGDIKIEDHEFSILETMEKTTSGKQNPEVKKTKLINGNGFTFVNPWDSGEVDVHIYDDITKQRVHVLWELDECVISQQKNSVKFTQKSTGNYVIYRKGKQKNLLLSSL